MGQYVYEVIEVTDYGKEVGEHIGAIRIESSFHGYYHEMARFIEKTWEIKEVGEMHFLFKIEADITKQRKKAIQEMEDKLAKKENLLLGIFMNPKRKTRHHNTKISIPDDRI